MGLEDIIHVYSSISAQILATFFKRDLMVRQCLVIELYDGTRFPMIHQLNPKACVNIKNGQLKVIKAVLRLSQHIIHALMFEIGFYF